MSQAYKDELIAQPCERIHKEQKHVKFTAHHILFGFFTFESFAFKHESNSNVEPKKK
jgi:hypothetical protein